MKRFIRATMSDDDEQPVPFRGRRQLAHRRGRKTLVQVSSNVKPPPIQSVAPPPVERPRVTAVPPREPRPAPMMDHQVSAPRYQPSPGLVRVTVHHPARKIYRQPLSIIDRLINSAR